MYFMILHAYECSRLFALFTKIAKKKLHENLLNFEFRTVHKCENLVDLKTLKSNYLVAKIGVDTAENGPYRV